MITEAEIETLAQKCKDAYQYLLALLMLGYDLERNAPHIARRTWNKYRQGEKLEE